MAKKDYSLHFRVNEAEYKKFQTLCESRGLKANTVFNILILQTINLNGKNIKIMISDIEKDGDTYASQ